MSRFKNRVKSKRGEKKKGHRRQVTQRAKRGDIIDKSWNDIKKRSKGE